MRVLFCVVAIKRLTEWLPTAWKVTVLVVASTELVPASTALMRERAFLMLMATPPEVAGSTRMASRPPGATYPGLMSSTAKSGGVSPVSQTIEPVKATSWVISVE